MAAGLPEVLAFACEDAEGTDPAGAADVDELVAGLAAIRDARRRLADVEAVWDAELVTSSDTGMRSCGYELRHHWKGSTSDKWDREGAFRAAVEKASEIVVASMQDGADQVDIVDLLLKAFRPEPKVTGLRPLGVNPDLYRERSSTGRWTVELVKDGDQ